MGAADGDGSGSTGPVEIAEGWVVAVDLAIELVLVRTTGGWMLAIGSEVLKVPLATVRPSMRLQCIVTTQPTRVVSAQPLGLGADAPKVADIIRTLPQPLSDVDTTLVLAPSARPGDVVVPPLPKDEPS